jgi:hypothetical protein
MKHYIRSLIITSLLLSPITALADTVPAEWAWQALNVVDVVQTLQIVDHPDQYHELNPFLGQHPSRDRILLTGTAFSAGHWLVTDYLIKNRSSTAVNTWETASIAVKLIVVGHNYSIGLSVKF